MIAQPYEKNLPKILIVEDEALLAMDLAQSLEDLGYVVTGTAFTGTDAVKEALESRPDLILMDINLPGELDGIAAYSRIREQIDVPVVYLTGYSEKDILERAKKTEPYGYLGKPISLSELRSTLDTALYKHAADKRVRESEERLRFVLESLPDLLFTLTSDGVFCDYYQPYHLDRLYVPPDKFLGRHYKEILPAEVAQLLEEALCRLQDTNSPQQFEYRMVIRDEESWFNAKISAQRNQDGGTGGVTIVVRDVTDRKRLEDTLSAQRDLGLALSAVSNLDEAFQLCMNAAIEVSGMEAAGIYMVGEDLSLHLVAHRGISDEFLGKVRHFPKELPEGRIVLAGSPHYYGSDPQVLSPFMREAMRKEGFRGTLVIPIVDQERVICSLHLASKKYDNIPFPIRKAIETIAAQMGSAVARIQAEEARGESEELYRALVETTDTGYVILDQQGNVLGANSEYVRLTGHKKVDEIKGRSVVEWTAKHDRQRNAREVEQCFANGSVRNLEIDYADGQGRVTPIEINATTVARTHGGMQIVTLCRDITERKKTEKQLKASLREKEILLREVHHRVKNNLSIIESLLRIQSRYAQNEALPSMIEEIQDRIKSMAMAHELLYQSENLSEISAGKYLRRLVAHLSASAGELSRGVNRITEIQEMHVAMETAIPLGFIVTELVSNSFKHAFPEGQAGELQLSLRSVADRQLELLIRDDGVGIGRNIDLKTPKSCGLTLVYALVKQLNGQIEIGNNIGTEVRVLFRDKRRETAKH